MPQEREPELVAMKLTVKAGNVDMRNEPMFFKTVTRLIAHYPQIKTMAKNNWKTKNELDDYLLRGCGHLVFSILAAMVDGREDLKDFLERENQPSPERN